MNRQFKELWVDPTFGVQVELLFHIALDPKGSVNVCWDKPKLQESIGSRHNTQENFPKFLTWQL